MRTADRALDAAACWLFTHPHLTITACILFAAAIERPF